MSALQVLSLEKSFRSGFIPKEVKVLKGLDFEVPQGQVTGFLGANGAGKTTTMKCLLGLTRPSSGEIYFWEKQKLNDEVRSQIGFLPERPYFYEYLTGGEFLEFYGRLARTWKRGELSERISSMLRRVNLEQAKDKKLREYSKGMLQRIGLAQALIHEPKLVILDEPMGGLDPNGRMDLMNMIRETAEKGTTVFFSSHLLNDIEKLCESLVILKKGELIFQGKTKDLVSRFQSNLILKLSRGDQIIEETLTGQDLAQARIRQALDEGDQILSLSPGTIHLEEIFVKLAGEESSP